jgi:hypothetical protein
MSWRILVTTVWIWMASAMVCLAQPQMLPAPETAPPQAAQARLVPMATPTPPIGGGLTDGAGLTPLAMAAPVGAIPASHKAGACHGCYNHKLCRFFTYCPILGGCGKGCSCCCPPLYTFFFCTPLPTTRINAPWYIGRWPASPVPLPQHTPLTPDK